MNQTPGSTPHMPEDADLKDDDQTQDWGHSPVKPDNPTNKEDGEGVDSLE